MKLEVFRKSMGWSQADLAGRLGLRSKGSIAMIESGARRASVDVAIKLEAISNGQVSAVDLRPDLAPLVEQRLTAGAAT